MVGDGRLVVPCSVSFGQKYVPINDVRVYASVFRHLKQLRPKPLPTCGGEGPVRRPAPIVGVTEGGSLREVFRRHHVWPRMQGPQCDHVVSVVRHHVQETLPKCQVVTCREILRRGVAWSVRRPREIELERSVLESWCAREWQRERGHERLPTTITTVVI